MRVHTGTLVSPHQPLRGGCRLKMNISSKNTAHIYFLFFLGSYNINRQSWPSQPVPAAGRPNSSSLSCLSWLSSCFYMPKRPHLGSPYDRCPLSWLPLMYKALLWASPEMLRSSPYLSGWAQTPLEEAHIHHLFYQSVSTAHSYSWW